MESSNSNYLNGISLINTAPIKMTLRNFNDLCRRLLKTDVDYINKENKDLNINFENYYHSTE